MRESVADAEPRRADTGSREPVAPVPLSAGLASAVGNRRFGRTRGSARPAERGRTVARCACSSGGVPCSACDQRAESLATGGAALARAVATRRVLARDNTRVDVQVAPGGCSLAQDREIEPAVRTAAAWLRRSLDLLDAFAANPTAQTTTATRTALQRNFHTTAVPDANHVRGRFATILNDMLTSPDLRTECHTNADTTCPAANAYVNGNLFVFCPIFFDFEPLAQAASVVHEMAHALTAGPHITDRAYRSNRYYRWMTSTEALRNAESYGMLARELGTGTQAPDTAPTDTIEDCPPDWDVALARSTAIGQRWNRNAQTKLRNRSATVLAHWTDLQTRYLGSTSTAALDRAQHVYDTAEDAFDSKIDFECEPGATGGRCAKYETYWYGWMSDFHICPSWRALPTEDARTESLLAGYYGYKDIAGDGGERRKLAQLARELTARYWPMPTP